MSPCVHGAEGPLVFRWTPGAGADAGGRLEGERERKEQKATQLPGGGAEHSGSKILEACRRQGVEDCARVDDSSNACNGMRGAGNFHVLIQQARIATRMASVNGLSDGDVSSSMGWEGRGALSRTAGACSAPTSIAVGAQVRPVAIAFVGAGRPARLHPT